MSSSRPYIIFYLLLLILYTTSQAQAEWAGFKVVEEKPYNGSFAGIPIGNLDSDPAADLLRFSRFELIVVPGNGDGTFDVNKSRRTNTPPDDKDKAIIGDVNGDDNADVVTINQGERTVSLFLGTGYGTFLSPEVFETKWKPIDIVVTNGINDVEHNLIAITENDDRLYVEDIRDAGIAPTPIRETSYGGDDLREVALADVNADGKTDLVIHYKLYQRNTSRSRVSVLLRNPDLSFSSHDVDFPGYLTFGFHDYHFGAGDVDEDGMTDIIGSVPDGDLIVLLSHGDGSFGEPALFEIDWYGPQPQIPFMIVGDFTGDGHLDALLSRTRLFKGITVFFGDGDGTFTEQIFIEQDRLPYLGRPADVNGDGRLDVIGGSNSIQALINLGAYFDLGLRFAEGIGGSPFSLGEFKFVGIYGLTTSNERTGEHSFLNLVFNSTFSGKEFGRAAMAIYDDKGTTITSAGFVLNGRTKVFTRTNLINDGGEQLEPETYVREAIALRGIGETEDGRPARFFLSASSPLEEATEGKYGGNLNGALTVSIPGIYHASSRIELPPIELDYAEMVMDRDGLSTGTAGHIWGNAIVLSDGYGKIPGGRSDLFLRYKDSRSSRPGAYHLFSRNKNFRVREGGLLHIDQKTARANGQDPEHILEHGDVYYQFSTSPAAVNILRRKNAANSTN